MGRRVVLALMLAGCNAKLSDAPGDGSTVDTHFNVQIDAASDGPIMLGMWGTPTPVQGASEAAINEDDVSLASTLTELYFASPSPLANSAKDLFLMTRQTPQDQWGPKQALTQFNTTTTEESPRLSPDDLTLYFGRNGEIYSATRSAIGMPWSAATPLAGVNTASYEKWLAVCNNGYFMISRANGANGQDLYQGQLGVSAGTLVSELSSTSSEISTFLSNDCLDVYFASNRAASGNTELYTAHRVSVLATWPAPTVVTNFGMATDNEDPWMSPNQRTFVFATVRGASTTKDLYISTR
jgi:hypothetical protein